MAERGCQAYKRRYTVSGPTLSSTVLKRLRSLSLQQGDLSTTSKHHIIGTV